MRELNELTRSAEMYHNLPKPRAYTTFSKMLIFINFHPPDEKSQWIHKEYMNSLKKRDEQTPRNYGDTIRQKSQLL